MSRPERGQYGNKRGKELQVRKRRNREADPRYQEAMEEVRRQQAELDALMAEQASNPAVGVVDGALYNARRKEQEKALAKAEREANKLAEQLPEACKEEIVEEQVLWADGMPRTRLDLRTLKQRGEDKFPFAETTGRLMLKAGYNIKYVIEFTGLGYQDLKGSVELDEDGYGIVEVEDVED